MKITMILLVTCISMYAGMYLFFVLLSPMPYKFMDFNKNGWVELNETFTAIDIGTRNMIGHNRTCKEYFYLKDGTQAYVHCK